MYMSANWMSTLVLCGLPLLCNGQAGKPDLTQSINIQNWRIPQDALSYLDSRSAGHKGSISFPGGVLRLEDNQNSAARGPEALFSQPVRVGQRFEIELRSRLMKIGLADESTGDTVFHLSLGAQSPGGVFGLDISLTGDRYNVDGSYKVWRTDSNWHTWRFEIDTQRHTIAMFRDGEYVCLHRAGSAQPAGLRIQVKGSSQTPALVEIGSLSIKSLAERTEPAAPSTLPKSTLEPGDWPLWRRDVGNTAVSPMVGHIVKPRIAWSVPVGGDAVTPEFVDLNGDGRKEALISRGGKLSAVRLDGTVVGAITAGEIYELPNLHAVPGPDKEFLCYDAMTGVLDWSLPLGTTSQGVVAADVDREGKPAFVFGTADGRLIALRGGSDPAKRILWQMTFPAALGPPIVCDVNGDGRMSILVSCADGRLYCVQ
jgi:hypothetical protein